MREERTPQRKRYSAGADENGAGQDRRRSNGSARFAYWLVFCVQAMRGLVGESPSLGRSTTTGAPILARL